MMIKFSLNNSSSIKRTIKTLEEYKKGLVGKCELFVSRLIEIGIQTAKANEGQYAGKIRFEKKLDESEYGCDGVLIATDGEKITREWFYHGEIKSVEISPLLMAEFGSGWLANVLDNVEGVGQGTFVDGDYKQKHAFDIDGWNWTTPDGVEHHSYGEAPTYPMHAALNAMMFEINRIANEVFGNG